MRPIFVLAFELIKSEIRWKYQKLQQFYDLPCLMSKMTDFYDFTDFNAPLFLYELVALIIIICVIGLSCSGCAAAPPEEPARADMRNHDFADVKDRNL